MDDGERVTLTSRQLKGLVAILVFAVLVITVLGLALRVEKPAVTASGRVAAGDAAEDDAELERGWQLLVGGRFTTSDFDPLNKSVGERVSLLADETELRVTPSRVAPGSVACAAGPVTTVELLVERVSGRAGLTPADFALLASDGSPAAPIQGCSAGFADASAQRTLVFAVERPDRLVVVGADPAHPTVVWHLS